METILVIGLIILGTMLVVHNLDLKKEPEEPVLEPTPEPEPEVEQPPPPFAVGRYTNMRLVHRNEHHLIIAPTGHGKTEFVKHLIMQDLDDGKAGIVVIDTKGDLIDDLLSYGPAVGPKTIVIDPRDVEYPFNLGFINFAQMKKLPPLEREIAYNGAIDLLTLTLGSLDAEMTTKQETLFSNVFRLLEQVPDATILTMLDVLRKGSQSTFQPYIDQLDPITQSFFSDMFYGGREYNDTKAQVARRLFDILNNPVLSRAFTDPNPTFNFTKAMDDGCIVLVNLSTQVLKNFSPTFGRFIMARILQATEERKTKRPVIVYADEALDYIDQSTDRILRKARSANVGLVLIVQSLAPVDPTLREVILGNTLIKSVGRMSENAARQVMATVRQPASTEEIRQADKGVMYTFSNNHINYELPEYANQYILLYYKISRKFIGMMPKQATRKQEVIDRMRRLYAVRPKAEAGEQPTEEPRKREPLKRARPKSTAEDPTAAKPRPK